MLISVLFFIEAFQVVNNFGSNLVECSRVINNLKRGSFGNTVALLTKFENSRLFDCPFMRDTGKCKIHHIP